MIVQSSFIWVSYEKPGSSLCDISGEATGEIEINHSWEWKGWCNIDYVLTLNQCFVPTFTSCVYPELTENIYDLPVCSSHLFVLYAGSEAYEKMYGALTNVQLTKAIKRASSVGQTSCLQSYHSLINQFPPPPPPKKKKKCSLTPNKVWYW